MAIATNTRTTYSAVGIREDLSNIIYNISPMDTPFMSSIGKGSCDILQDVNRHKHINLLNALKKLSVTWRRCFCLKTLQ